MVETKRNSTAKEPFSAGWEAISCNTVSFRSAVSSEQVSPVLVEARVRGLAKSLPATSICRSVARTFTVGTVSDEALRLISVTEGSFYEAMKVARPGNRIGDIGFAVESFVISNGFSVVKDFVGHGLGKDLHEEPEIPNYGRAGRGARLYPGMTLAIEPMVNAGSYGVRVLSDGWTVETSDGALSAHYENSILITDNDPIILTDVNVK